jgi:hypothetical protein
VLRPGFPNPLDAFRRLRNAMGAVHPAPGARQGKPAVRSIGTANCSGRKG